MRYILSQFCHLLDFNIHRGFQICDFGKNLYINTICCKWTIPWLTHFLWKSEYTIMYLSNNYYVCFENVNSLSFPFRLIFSFSQISLQSFLHLFSSFKNTEESFFKFSIGLLFMQYYWYFMQTLATISNFDTFL